MKRLISFSTVLCLVVAAMAAPAMAAGEDADAPKIQVRFLIQPQMQIIQAKKNQSTYAGGQVTPDDNGIGQEFFLRRTRVILAGRINKWIHFFFETDNPNLGRDLNVGGTFTQDGFIDFRFFKEFKVAMGMILLPFTRHNRQSAASLMGLDYHSAVYTMWGPQRIWRDYGVEARGTVIDKIDYRIGLFRGFRGPSATNDIPRITGRVSYDLFGAESKFFYGGTYLGNAKHVALGFGFDIQPEGGVDGKGFKDAYYALTGDVFVDWPLANGMAATLNSGFMFYSWAPKKLAYQTSTAFFTEAGFFWKGFQPVVGIDLAQPLDTKAFKDVGILNFRVGINYFIKGHNAAVKLEYASERNNFGSLTTPGTPPGPKGDVENFRRNVITLQTQLLF